MTFGGFVLDETSGTLRYRSLPVALRRKELGLLLLLAGSGGAVVSKDEIIERIWQKADVSDAAIVQSIYRLRRALSKYEPGVKHIGTVTGRGYRFMDMARDGAQPPLRDSA